MYFSLDKTSQYTRSLGAALLSLSPEDAGAFTGEVSPAVLREAGAHIVEVNKKGEEVEAQVGAAVEEVRGPGGRSAGCGGGLTLLDVDVPKRSRPMLLKGVTVQCEPSHRTSIGARAGR